MTNVLRYPRGYTTLMGNPSALQPEGFTELDVPCDDTIDALFKMYLGKTVNVSSWQYRKQVIARCSQLFGGFFRWLTIQSTFNNYVYGLNYDFLVDTVNFIQTGQRRMMVYTWMELLLEYPTEKLMTANRVRARELPLTNPSLFDDYIGMWCSQPGGFEDLLWTAYTLFGSSKTPLKSHTPL